MKRILDGMNILAKHLDPAKHWDFAAEHDEVFCDGPAPTAMPPEDAAKLGELGWSYRDGEGWHHFA